MDNTLPNIIYKELSRELTILYIRANQACFTCNGHRVTTEISNNIFYYYTTDIGVYKYEMPLSDPNFFENIKNKLLNFVPNYTEDS